MSGNICGIAFISRTAFTTRSPPFLSPPLSFISLPSRRDCSSPLLPALAEEKSHSTPAGNYKTITRVASRLARRAKLACRCEPTRCFLALMNPVSSSTGRTSISLGACVEGIDRGEGEAICWQRRVFERSFLYHLSPRILNHER